MEEPRPPRPAAPRTNNITYRYIKPVLEDDVRPDQRLMVSTFLKKGYNVGDTFQKEGEGYGIFFGVPTIVSNKNYIKGEAYNFIALPKTLLKTHFILQNEATDSAVGSSASASSLGGRRKRRKSTRRKTYRKYRKHYSRKYKK